MKPALLALLLALLAHHSSAKEPNLPISCGSVVGIKSLAEIQRQPESKIYNLQLTFITKKPPAPEIDKALRACLAVASKADGKWDILATAWLRRKPTDNANDDEILSPYGGMKYIIYEAASKSVLVKDVKLQK
jgi:hypothetical protein